MQNDTMNAGPKSDKSSMMKTIVMIVLVLALLGVGFWGFQTNSKLTATSGELAVAQTDLATLQGKYDSLTKDNAQLASDLAQTKTDLEKAQADLAKAQSDLTKSQDQGKELQAKIASASKKTEALYAFLTVKTTEDFLVLDTMITATNDKDLIAQWSIFTSSPTTENSANFLLYLITDIKDDLK